MNTVLEINIEALIAKDANNVLDDMHRLAM
jgi:hypothetical protein